MPDTIDALLMPFLDALILVAVVLVVVRLVGLRAFSKMTTLDFPLTVAIGSVIAATVLNPGTPYLTGAAAILAIFAVQAGLSFARSRNARVLRVTDNTPLLLMEGAEILDDNLGAARLTRTDLRAKLREANVLDLTEVRAVVLEATGDISVLHGPADGVVLADELLEGVRRNP